MAGRDTNSGKLVTIGEAARLLGVSIQTVRRWEKKGLLKAVREGSGYRYFLLEEIERFQQERPLTISEAAAELGISPAVLRRHESEGRITPQRGEHGERLYTRSILREFTRSLVEAEETKNTRPNLTAEPQIGKLSTFENVKREHDHLEYIADVVALNQHYITRFTVFQKWFYMTIIGLVGLVVAVFLLITTSFLLFPERTGDFLVPRSSWGLPRMSVRIPDTQILGARDSKIAGVAVDTENSRLFPTLLWPFTRTSLYLVSKISPEAYQRALPETIEIGLNAPFTVDESGNIYPEGNLYIQGSQLRIESNELVTNLNAQYVQGREPGGEAGNLLILNELGDLQISGRIVTPSVGTEALIDGSVTEAKIATGVLEGLGLEENSVASIHIKDGEVKTGDLAAGAVDTNALASSSVNSAKIKDGSITGADIAADAITSDHLEDGTIASGDLGAGSVTTSAIADGTVGTSDVADGAITSAKISDGTIATADLADSVVTSIKIVDDSITASDLNSNLTFGSGDLINLSAITYNSTTPQGLLLPNAPSDAPSSPSSGEGYIAWDTLNDQIIVYDGSSWGALTGGGGGSGDITAVGNCTSGACFNGTQGTQLVFNDADGDGTLAIADLSATRSYTLPDASGTIILSGHTFTGDVGATLGTGGTTTLTVQANSIALGTDTVNNYVATVADAGNSTISVSGSGIENAAITLDVVDVNCTDCLSTPEIADVYVLNSGDVITGAVTVDGSADAIQLTVQGNATQTSNLVVFEQSDGTDVFTVTNGGAVTAASTLSAPTLTLTGTGTINGLDAMDATTETTLEGALDLSGDISGTLATATIGNDKVLEAHLKAVDTAGDEECLTYESTGGDFEWQTCSTGMSSFVLSDGTNTQTIADGNTLSVLAGNDIDTTVSATDTVTIALESTIDSVSTINLSGTGTINGLDAIDSTSETTLEGALDIAGEVSGTGLGSVVISCTDCINATEVEDIYVFNTGDTITGAVTVDGSADAIQLTVQGNATQTSNLVVFEQSDGTDVATITNAGAITASSTLSAPTLTLTGTGTLNGLDAIDGTTETTLEGALDIGGEVTGTGLSNVSISCTDCLNATEIEDIYLLNAGDTADGSITFAAGLSVSASQTITIGGDAIDEFVGTGLQLSSGDLQTTLGTSIANTELDNDTIDFDKISDTASLDTDTSIAAGAGEELTYNKTFTDATTENGAVFNFTASDTSSGTTSQFGLYIDNIASTEGLDASLVIDNSDTDDAVGAAIKIVNAGGNFTSVIDNAGTLISSSELNLLDGGITLGELTDSGTLTATIVDINGGNIDGTVIGATTRAAGSFTTVNANGNTTLGDANSDTLTINAGSSGSGITFADSSFATCTALETVSGVLTCGTDDTGGGSGTLQQAYDSDANGSDATIAINATDDSIILSNPSSSGTDSAFVLQIDQNATGSSVAGIHVDDEGTALALNVDDAGDGDIIDIFAEHTSFANDIITLQANEEDTGTFTFLKLISDADGTPDTELTINQDGDIATDGSISGTNLTATGTTGLTFSGSGGDITFTNNEKIDNDADGTIAITAPTTALSGDLTISGGNITNAVTFDSGLSVAASQTITIGGDAIDEFVGTGLQLSSGDLQTTLGTAIDTTEITNNTIDWVDIVDATSLDAATSVTGTAGEIFTFNRTLTDATSENGLVINVTAQDTSSGTTAQYGLAISNAASTEGADALLYIDNADADDAVADAIRITSAAGTISTGLDFDDTDITTDIEFQNDETIDNNTNGTILITAPTTQTSGNVTIAGTTGLVFSGSGGDITFTNNEKIDNDADGTIAITAPTTALSGDLTISGGNITNAVTFDSGLSVAASQTITIGGDAIDEFVGTGLQLSSGDLQTTLGTAIDTTEITNDTIDEDDLDVVTGDTPADGECLTFDDQAGTGDFLWTGCGGSVSLDDAYNNGATITVDAADILFDLNDSTNDYGFVIDNNTGGAIAIGLEFTSGGGGALTTAIDASATAIATALSVGANDIVGTTGLINFDNFDVDASGNVTLGDIIIGGGNINPSAALTIGDNGDTLALDSSDWDISVTGAITGASFDANGTGNSLSNVENADLVNDTIDWDKIADATALDTATSITGTAGEVLTLTRTLTNDTDENGMTINITASDTGGATTAQYGLALSNAASTEGADALLYIDNADTDDSVADAIRITSAAGTVLTGLDFDDTDIVTDIEFQNDETISNNTDGTILITAPTTQTSGNLTVAGTTGLAFSGSGGDITFTNNEKIDNDADGTIAITAPTTALSGDLTISGGNITNGVTFDSGLSVAASQTITIGGDAIDEFVGTGLQLSSGDLQTTLGTAIDTTEITNNTIDWVDIVDATSLDAATSVTGTAGEVFTFTRTLTDAADENGLVLGVTASDTGGSTTAQYGLSITNAASTEGLDSLIFLTNADADDSVADAIRITSAAGTIGTGLDFDDTDIVTDIEFQNDETISNNTDGTVLITAPTTQTSGNLTVAGTTGIVFSGSGGDITFTNNEKIDNDADGTITITAPTTSLSGDLAISGGNITSAVTFDSGLSVAASQTITIGGDAIDEFVGTGLQLSSGDLQTTLGTAIDTSEITNATIDADDLDQADEDGAPADGECLKFETSGGGDFLWGSCGSSSTLQQAYDAGGAGDQVITLDATQDSIEIDNPAASGSDSAFAFFIDQNDTTGVDAVFIDSESTDSNALLITHAGDGTDNAAAAAISITAESGAGGLFVTRNLGAGDDDPLVEILSDHASGDQPALFIDNDATGGIAFDIDAENTSADIVNISATPLTTGNAIDIPDLNALTTGKGINILSNANAITSGMLFSSTHSNTDITASKSGVFNQFVANRSTTTGTDTDDFDVLLIQRVSETSGGSLTTTGSVLKVTNTASQLAGTLADSAIGIELVMSAAGTGDSLWIDSNQTATANSLDIDHAAAGTDAITVLTEHGTYAADIVELATNEEDTGTFNFLNLISDADGTPDTELTINQDGDIVTDGSISGLNLTAAGTTGLTFSGSGGDITFTNNEKIDNDADGTIAITAPTTSLSGDLAISGGNITSAVTFDSGLSVAASQTITIGGDAIDEFVGTGLQLSSGDLQTTLGTAIDTTEITNDTIDEDDLDVVTGDTPADGECLTFDDQAGTGDFLWTGCGGGSGSLDDAYNNGATITVDAADILFDLNDSTNDYGFVIDNNTGGAIAIGLEFTSGGGGALTTAIDASATAIATALSVGANDIVGTTGLINFDNFDVDASGNVTLGDIIIGGGNINPSAALTIGDNGDALALDSSDWDISVTGAITGASFDANGTGNSLSNVENADLVNDTIDWDKIADATALDTATSITGTAGEVLTLTRTLTNDTAENGMTISVTASDTGGATTAQYGLAISNAASTEGADALLYIDNADEDDSVADAIRITSAAGTIATGLDFDDTDITTDIEFQNDETIDNNVNGTILITAPTTQTSGNLTVAGTTGLVFSGSGGDITFTNNEKIDNDADGTIAITAPTTSLSGDLAISGGNITSAVTFDSGLTVAASQTITIGGDAIDEFVGTGLQLSSGDLQTTLGLAIDTTEITNNTIDWVDIADATSLDAATSIAGTAGEVLTLTRTLTNDTAENAMTVNVTASDTGGATTAQYGLAISNAASTEGADALLFLDNADADDSVADAIRITSAAGTVLTGLDFDDTDITTDIEFQNDETISNNTDGTVLITAPTTSLSGDLAISGGNITTALTFDENISVAATKTITIGGDAIDEFVGTGLQLSSGDLQTTLGTAIDTSEITNGTIDADDLDQADEDGAPADGECLKFEDSGGGDFLWGSCSAGGAGTLQQSYDTGAAGDQVITLDATQDSIEIDNPAASGSDSAFAFFLDQNDTTGVDAFLIDSESTDSNGILILHAGDGTDNAAAAAISITAESGAGALFVQRNLGAGDDDPLVEILSDHASGDQPALYIDNDATAAQALDIDADNTTGDVITVDANALTTGDLIQGSSTAIGFTSGELLNLDYIASGNLGSKTGNVASINSSRTNSVNSSTDIYDVLDLSRTSVASGSAFLYQADGAVLRIENIVTDSVGGVLTDSVVGIRMVMDADGIGDSLWIDSNQTATANSIDIDHAAAATDAINILAENTAYTADVIELASNEEDTGTFNFLKLISDADGTPDTELIIDQDGTITTDGGLVAGAQIVTASSGVEFTESDSNPTCAAGNFTIYADTSENKLKKCENGTASDLDGNMDDVDVFTATGANTWTRPANVSDVYVEVWGGGEGGITAGANSSGGGGGGGAYSAALTGVNGDETATVGIAGTANGGDGGNSTFTTDGSTVTANGGNGASTVNGGSGGTASNGDLNLAGGVGGSTQAGDGYSGGDGGNSPLGGAGGGGGPGGNAAGANIAGKAGSTPGGGGGGGGEASGAGGGGGVGLIVVWEITGSITGADLAEWYETEANVEPGDAVAVSDKTLTYSAGSLGTQDIAILKKAQAGDDLVGIVSSVPSKLMGFEINKYAEHPQPIALYGRVPLKVSTMNGPIKRGDLLTASSIPGVAMRATKAGQTIGSALEDFDAPSGEIGKVLTLVNTTYSVGARTRNILEEHGTSLSEEEWRKPGVDMGRLLLADMLGEKDAILTSNVPISEVYTDRIGAGLEVVTPRVVTDTVAANYLEPALNNDLVLRLDPEKEGKFIIGQGAATTLETLGADVTAVTEFDAHGNATFAGTVTADTIRARQIEGMEIFTDNLSSLSARVAGLSDRITADPGIDGLTITPSPSPTKTPETVSFKELTFERGEIIDVQVLGTLVISGTLTVDGKAEFAGEVLFSALTEFGGTVRFEKDVTFAGRPVFDADTAGTAKITTGQRRVAVTFAREYAALPIVNANLVFSEVSGEDPEANQLLEDRILEAGYSYVISRRTAQGFTIVLNKPAAEDLTFSWVALAVQDGTTATSTEEELKDIEPSSTPTPTPTAETTPSSSPEPSIDPTPSPSNEPTIKVLNNELGFLRVRSEPNADSAELAQVSPGQTFAILAQENDWYQVEYAAGQTGWLSGSYVETVQ